MRFGRRVADRLVHRVGRLAALAVAALPLGACSLDAFLFNGRALDRYTLSNAIIPDSLRLEGEWQTGGERIAYVFARQPGTAPRPSMIFCHGNKFHIGEYWDRVEHYWQAGFDVLTFDYRGYGRSTGTPTEAALRSDSEEALDFLRGRGVADSSITVLGFSLGGVCALHLAANRFAPRALVLEAAFTSGEGLVRTGAVLDIPGRYLLRSEFDNLTAVSRTRAPLLILHGTDDTFVPFTMGQELLAASRTTPRRLEAVRGANHSDIPATMGPAAYRTLIRQFHDGRGVVGSPP